jgi:hypothetical protein
MKKLILPALVLSLAVFGCTLFSGATTSNDLSRSAATAAPAQSATQPGEAAPPSAPVPGQTYVPAADLFLPNPAAGLDGLKSYHQEFALTSRSGQGSGPDDFENVYLRDVWPAGQAGFTVLKITAAEGSQEILTGALGAAHYFRAAANDPCQVTWGASAAQSAPVIEPADLLPPVGSAAAAGTETLAGLSAKHYTFKIDSAGLQGSGELWLADQGGLLLKYSLDLKSSSGVTQTYRYALTQVDALGDPALPQGCPPVLTEIPAMDGATSLQRLPQAMDYATTASVAEVSAFYEEKMKAAGWVLTGNHNVDPQNPTLIFANQTSLQIASIEIEVDTGQTWVSVIVRAWPAGAPAGTPTP